MNKAIYKLGKSHRVFDRNDKIFRKNEFFPLNRLYPGCSLDGDNDGFDAYIAAYDSKDAALAALHSRYPQSAVYRQSYVVTTLMVEEFFVEEILVKEDGGEESLGYLEFSKIPSQLDVVED